MPHLVFLRPLHFAFSVCLLAQGSPEQFTFQWCTHAEETFCRTRIQCSILDLCLFGKVISRFNRGQHPFHGEESSQVSRVWWDDDECEEPPYTANYSARHWPKEQNSTNTNSTPQLHRDHKQKAQVNRHVCKVSDFCFALEFFHF